MCVPILRRSFHTTAVATAGPPEAFTRATVVVFRAESLENISADI